jgi:tetratricopeptide (TPR) repeat protein
VTDISSFEIIMERLNQILIVAPTQQSATMLLSLIYFDTGRYDKLIDLTHDVFEKSQVIEQKFRFGVLLAQSFRNLKQPKKAEDIVNKMKTENIQLFYAIVFQIYEQEKSKMALKMKDMFTSSPENEENLFNYAKYLIKQQNFDEAKKLLQRPFENENSNFERLYLLSTIYEKLSNLIFALEIASPLRRSDKPEHIAHLLKLMKKLGYYGDAENILREKRNISSELGRFQYMQNVFKDYKIIA